MKEDGLRINHLIFGFCLVAIVSYTLLSFSYISYELKLALIVFNFFYVFLTFPLNGTLTVKISMLLIGNIIGLLWNHLFSLFAYTAAYYLGDLFNTLYIILNPFVNLIYIVSFWSISLTRIASSKSKKQGLS